MGSFDRLPRCPILRHFLHRPFFPVSAFLHFPPASFPFFSPLSLLRLLLPFLLASLASPTRLPSRRTSSSR